jgi:hypothetical protein
MSRRVLLAVAVWAALESVAWPGIPTSLFTISTSEKAGRCYLVVQDGQLKVAPLERSVEWLGRPAPGRWYIEGTRIKSSTGDGYLAYNPSASDGKVYLAPGPGPDTEWVIQIPGKGDRQEGKRGVIRAAAGPMKDWYLSVEEGVDEHGEGRRTAVRSLALRKQPAGVLEAERIWEHK